jgi:hypothetical protein
MPSRAARDFRVLCTCSGTSRTCIILDMLKVCKHVRHMSTTPGGSYFGCDSRINKAGAMNARLTVIVRFKTAAEASATHAVPEPPPM